MQQAATAPPQAARPGMPGPLQELLGGAWTMDATVLRAAWSAPALNAPALNAAEPVAAFALGDGTVALARATWPGAARVQPREGGGVELVPAEGEPPPVIRARVHAGACLALASAADGSVHSGGEDGMLARVDPDGTVEVLRDAGGPVAALAVAADGRHAVGTGRHVAVDGATERHAMPAAVQAVAFDPAGKLLAVGHADGIGVVQGGAWRALAGGTGDCHTVAWSPDGTFLAAATQAGVRCWRMPDATAVALAPGPATATDLSWTADGSMLAAAGGVRAVCWSPARPDAPPTLVGVGSAVPVNRVAFHPQRAVLALGYGNGVVLLSQPGTEGVVIVRGLGGGTVTALAWSPHTASQDGAMLAIGSHGGGIAVVAIPALLFRADPPSAQTQAAA